VQALANASQRSIEVSPELEATTRGAGFLAGLALGTWSSDDDVMAAWEPARIVQPAGSFDRDRWRDACRRAGGWIPELSSLDF
jgi:glycerol kinase